MFRLKVFAVGEWRTVDRAWTSGISAPADPQLGDGWHSTGDDELRIYDGSIWQPVVQDEVAAQTTAPLTPTEGQLWYDTAANQLKAYDGSTWEAVGGTSTVTVGATVANTAPSSPITGALWFDTTTLELKVWNGSSWVLTISSMAQTPVDPADPDAPVTSTLSVVRLAAAMRVGDGVSALTEPLLSILTRLSGVGDAFIELLAPGAPDIIKAEAKIRFAAYLYDMPETTAGDRFASAWRNSGAAGLVAHWVVRHATGIGVILPVAAVMTRDDVIAIIREFVFDWAETGNTDQIPMDKLTNV